MSIAFSKSGALFAVSSETDVSVYETESFHMIARTDTGFKVSDLAFISGTELLLLSKRKGTVQRWDREENRFMVIHSGRERAPYFASSDGRYFLVQNEEEKAQIYQSSGEPLCEISCEREVHCCDFSRSGQILLVTGGEGSIHQLADGRCLHRFSGVYGRIWQACFNPEGNRALLGHEKSVNGGGLSVWYLDRMFEV